MAGVPGGGAGRRNIAVFGTQMAAIRQLARALKPQFPPVTDGKNMGMKKLALFALAGGLTVALAGPLLARNDQCGRASWYDMPGNRTANGEIMDPNAMTAAHRTLPFGSVVRVVNQTNGKSVRVRINDRGPFIAGRIIDVSKQAANRLGFRNAGVTRVCLTRIS
jgi:peptidoglycan lytic transglycosylase